MKVAPLQETVTAGNVILPLVTATLPNTNVAPEN